MKLNKHENVKPNLAGLMSQVQQAEMKLILAGTWPPLKPLPVFKYGAAEYRAEIHFDSTRGEWVCRKTSLPSNKVQELRGGLTEMTMALPHGQAEDLTEAVAAEQQDQEWENEASRRLQAIVKWKENYGNGALYSQLQDYLSESQQSEIHDSIRMTLTARQLQFNPKNVEFVFDALWNAGGRLATLMEIAQRNKAEQEADAQAQPKAAALEAESQMPVEAFHPTRDRRLQTRSTPASLAHVMFGDTNGGIVVNISEAGLAVAGADLLVVGDCLPCIRIQLPSSRQCIEISAQIVWLAQSKKAAGIRFVDLTADARNQISNWIASEKPTTPVDEIKPQQGPLPIPAATPADADVSMFASAAEISNADFPQSLEASFPSRRARNFAPEPIKTSIPELAEDLQEKVRHHAPVAGFGSQVRAGKVESSADRIEDSPSHFHVLEISGVQVAAFVFLFAVIGLTVVLIVGRGPLGKGLRDAQKSILAVDATSPALPNHPGETTLPSSTPPAANTFNTPAVVPPVSETEESPSESPSGNPEASPEGNGSTGLIAQNATPGASPKPAHSSKAVDPISGASGTPAPSRVTPATAAVRHPSPPFAVLVRGPGDGSKPFTLILPEEPIAASSSFAMKSQLSVLVAPVPGPGVTRKPSRLQAGELVSYVWPRYPRPGDRHGSSETVKVRATVGQLGQVLDIKLVKGSISLLPATTSAIRQWRYKPTLLNGRPVQAQQDVTIEFRHPQYLSHLRTQRPPHN
jgi:hypothetical protein